MTAHIDSRRATVVPEEVIEIETVTNLTGPLAERLIKLAAIVGKEPVDALADIVERGLSPKARGGLPRRGPIQRNRSDDRRVAALQREMDELRSKLRAATQRPPDDRALRFAPDIEQFLKAEAKARNMKVEALLRAIIEAVVEDRLFAAVLDQ